MPAMLLIAFVILLICILAYYFLQKEHARGARPIKYVNPMQPKRGFFNNLNDAMYAKTFGKGMVFA